MSDRPAPDTEPCPATAPEHDPPEPSRRQMMDRIEAQSGTLAEVLDLALQCLEQVSQARHAIAVVADDVLERRAALDRITERLDILDADGCAAWRAHHRAGNGGGG
jgi:hypothetical protein